MKDVEENMSTDQTKSQPQDAGEAIAGDLENTMEAEATLKQDTSSLKEENPAEETPDTESATATEAEPEETMESLMAMYEKSFKQFEEGSSEEIIKAGPTVS